MTRCCGRPVVRIARYVLAVTFFAAFRASATAGESIDFRRDIRPILSDACFACHGPDSGQRKADLRLDIKEGAFEDRGDHQTIAPGKPDASELYRRITTTDPAERMPPAKSGKRLSLRQIELIRTWIEQGANWGEHWAFVSPRRPPLPIAVAAPGSSNPIDVFVRARLRLQALSPSPEAERATLLRRLSLDLIGLPPTIDEVDAFLADGRPDAYERQLERLLASPNFGERWGRNWLDAARYADSDGFEKDKPRNVWFYRDWVLAALNRDLPYDRFIVEQIAGDLLPHPSQDQIVATGFLRNSMINEEGGVDPEQFRMEAMFDRMDAIGKSILGLTIQCAQCHSHKFDPITQDDYYRMFAFLNDTHEANIEVYTPEDQERRAAILGRIREIEAGLQQRHPQWRARMSRWAARASLNQLDWTVLRPSIDDISTGGQKYLPQPDGSFLAQSYAPTKHRVQMTVRTDMPRITGFRLELLTDPNLPRNGPGRSIVGTCALSEFEVEAAPSDDPKKTSKVKWAKASADVEPPATPLDSIFDDKSNRPRVTGPVRFAIDGSDDTAWGIDIGPGRRNQDRKAVFVPESPIENVNGTILTIYLSQKHGGWNSDDNQNNNLGRFRLSITDVADPSADPTPSQVRAILATPEEKWTAEQSAAVFSYWRTTLPEWRKANEDIDWLWHQHPQGMSQLVLQQRAQPRMTHVLDRGDFLRPMRPVEPGVPAFLHAKPQSSGSPREVFARWLVAREAPTTARVIVNRVWQEYFGTGLVATSEEFGSQGNAPSHPELLDWLAVAFMDQGWSLKALHRLIATSATYRQSSSVTAALFAADPSNRLLARGPRLRVDAEVVRDIALSVSGLLDTRVGGPSVTPPAPAFLFVPPVSYGPKSWIEATGADRYRRAVYTFRFRSVPYPALQTFDAPAGDAACVRRVRSNTPLQALTTLNEPLFVECAQALALRTLREADLTDHERLVYAFRLCLARRPIDAEAEHLLALLERSRRRFSTGEVDPLRVALVDPSRRTTLPDGVEPERLAAWNVVARVLLNLDETISRE